MAIAAATNKNKRAAKSKESVVREPTLWQPPPAKRPDIFMTLPPELRNIIYEDVLSDTLPISVHPARKVPTALGGTAVHLEGTASAASLASYPQ
ncbi:hypothetical protein LTR15_008084 [Elasticomyces elasticus]|nr:hypothetical protein LTR15_008084 [Elasticomyces elasticus]